jgi:hypothetical protein
VKGYFFKQENKQIWLDIPHYILEKLELSKGENFPWPFYLAELVLKRDSIEGAITIEKWSWDFSR